MSRAAWLACLGVGAVACATAPSDPLASMHPYVWASKGELEWFTCRWRTEQPVGYAILGTDAVETGDVRRVLDLWEGMGLGVRFEEVPVGAAQLLLAAVDEPVSRDDGSRGAGRTIADCKLASGQTRPRAQLVRARVEVSRAVGPDVRGKMRSLDRDEWLGTWIHELGHALGYQGHLRRGDDPMRLEPDYQRFVGERIRSGTPVTSPALRALYARPSGTRLGSAAVAVARTRDLDEIGRLAAEAEIEGPFLRSGDRAARLFWRNARGTEYGFLVFDFPDVLEEPATLVLLPEPLSRRRLR